MWQSPLACNNALCACAIVFPPWQTTERTHRRERSTGKTFTCWSSEVALWCLHKYAMRSHFESSRVAPRTSRVLTKDSFFINKFYLCTCKDEKPFFTKNRCNNGSGDKWEASTINLWPDYLCVWSRVSACGLCSSGGASNSCNKEVPAIWWTSS